MLNSVSDWLCDYDKSVNIIPIELYRIMWQIASKYLYPDHRCSRYCQKVDLICIKIVKFFDIFLTKSYNKNIFI